MDAINQHLFRIRKQEQYRQSLIRLQHQHEQLYRAVELGSYDALQVPKLEGYLDALQQTYLDAIELIETVNKK